MLCSLPRPLSWAILLNSLMSIASYTFTSHIAVFVLPPLFSALHIDSKHFKSSFKTSLLPLPSTSNVPFRFHLPSACCHIPGPTWDLYTSTLLELLHHKVICKHFPWRFPSGRLSLPVANRKENSSDCWPWSSLSHLQPNLLLWSYPSQHAPLSPRTFSTSATIPLSLLGFKLSPNPQATAQLPLIFTSVSLLTRNIFCSGCY